MKLKKSLFALVAMMCVVPAFAGWQYDGYYIDDGYYRDDGTRFIVGFRGGLSWANARLQNEIGSLDGYYYVNNATGAVISAKAYDAYIDGGGESTAYTYAGVGDLSSLPAKENFSKMSFTAGGSVGFTLPYQPNWRIEGGYDHISEIEYSQIPLFEGSLPVSGGGIGDAIIHVASSGVVATVSTDIFSVMGYYDYFEKDRKPLDEFIPYLGFGIGYASSRTSLKLSDIYGDLSTDTDLINYGQEGADGVLQFLPPSDSSKFPTSSNIALVGALGVSYGISRYTFIDLSARLTYVPKITWQLVNSDATMRRDWFAAKDMLYTNLMFGLRFEF